MLVPTMAFALWVVALPAAQSPVTLDELQAASALLDTSGERVVLRQVTADIVSLAEGFLELPLAAERYLMLDGKRYVFVVEHHYHPPGYPAGPAGWHKGVTVYELR
jgi:hypothetical protein